MRELNLNEAGEPTLGLMMDYPLTLTQILTRAGRIFGRRQTLEIQTEIISKLADGSLHSYGYPPFYERTCQLGHALKKAGIKPGDRIGTLAWNSFRHMELYFAVPCLGAILHTLNLRYSVDQLAYVIDHAEDQFLFVDANLVPLLEKVQERAPQKLKLVKKIIVLDGDEVFCKRPHSTLPPLLSYEEWIRREPTELDWPVLDEKTAAGLCYTSGTTGEPKGALYSHRSQFLHALAIGMADTIGIKSSDTILPVVPMFHANAWGLPYIATLLGAKLVFPGMHLKPSDLAQLIEDHRVTIAAGVPTLWLGLLEELKKKKYDVSSLRTLIVGGSAVPKSLIEAFEEKFGIPILHAWGMTELSPTGTLTRLSDPSRLRARQGYPAPCMEIRIVGEDGADLPWDGKTMGELQVKGPWVISSYYKASGSEGNREAFTSDGWFKTGDIAQISSDGSMLITDRSKDLIKSGGEWISSVAIENHLMSHPLVQEAAVIAAPDKKWGEVPLAVVVSKAQKPLEEDLKQYLSQAFAKFWIPKEIIFLDQIPKTSVGKFDKKSLREQFSAEAN